MRLRLITALLIVAPLSAAIAQPIIPPPSEPAEAVQRAEPSEEESQGFTNEESDVQIIQRGDKTIEEYRLNGRLYMIKVTHKGFPPYYLIDRDGDGTMEEQVSEVPGDVKPPTWVIKRW
jgi:hypothetical protein